MAVSTIDPNGLNIGQIGGTRNKIINGNFDVWQRGSSFTTTGTFLYFADRWTGFNYNAGSQVDRQEFTVGQTDVPNEPTYYIRVTTGGSEYWLAQKIEDVRTFAGQTVTLSWWGRASANTTITARATQVFGSGGSSDVNVATQNFNFTTSWQKFTWTTDIASIAGKTVGSSSFLQMWWQGNLSSAGTTIDFAQVQLEAGDTATPFEHRSYGQELALCERYYNRTTVHIQTPTGGVMIVPLYFRTTMRAAPTTTNISAGSTAGGITSPNIGGLNTGGAYFQVNSSANSNYILDRIDQYDAEL